MGIGTTVSAQDTIQGNRVCLEYTLHHRSRRRRPMSPCSGSGVRLARWGTNAGQSVHRARICRRPAPSSFTCGNSCPCASRRMPVIREHPAIHPGTTPGDGIGPRCVFGTHAFPQSCVPNRHTSSCRHKRLRNGRKVRTLMPLARRKVREATPARPLPATQVGKYHRGSYLCIIPA